MAVYMRMQPPKDGDDLIGLARTALTEKYGLAFGNDEQRELFLTHRLIARKAGYERLLKAYSDRGGFARDQFLSGEDGIISFFTQQIEPLAQAWEAGKIGRVVSVLRARGFTLADNKAKASSKAAMEKLITLRKNKTIEAVLRHVADTGLLQLRDDLVLELQLRKPGEELPAPATEDDERHQRFYNALFATPYSEAVAFKQFLDEHSPFATKHGVKGDEFDTVFVVLDDKGAAWNLYSFDKYLSGADEKTGHQERAARTRNLFYVCCSRAKVNLFVIDLGASSPSKDARVRQLFGVDHCLM
jgi:DNA helicase-2/ATP-dependent DNA helicase PcrA